MQFSIFCSSGFVFEGWKFTSTDRSLLYTMAKASHILIHERKLSASKTWHLLLIFFLLFLQDRGRECSKQVQRKIIVQSLCPIFSTCIAWLNLQIRFGILQWELEKLHTLVAGIYMHLPMELKKRCVKFWNIDAVKNKHPKNNIHQWICLKLAKLVSQQTPKLIGEF